MEILTIRDIIKADELLIHNQLRVPLNSRQRAEMRGEYPYYGATGQMDSINTYKFDGFYTLVAEDGTVYGANGISPMIQRVRGKFWVSNHAHVLQGKDEVDTKYLALALEMADVRSNITGAVQLKLSKENLLKLKIYWPERKAREEILKLVDPIDQKIELCKKMNATFDTIGRSLFQHTFVDNAYKDSWQKRRLGEFFPVKTGKKDANFGTEDGEYPFFTCAQSISKAPDFSFDAHALLLAGNGDFNLKLYRGKFEAYQRTYVLVPENEHLLGILYFLMSINLHEITGGSRGSVIKFITKGMIENYKFALPEDAELQRMGEVFNELTISIEEGVVQIQVLTTLRNALLMRLID